MSRKSSDNQRQSWKKTWQFQGFARIEELEARLLLSTAFGTDPSETLADLPVAAQTAISTDIGRDQVQYHATAGPEGLSLANLANGFTAQLQSGALVVDSGADSWRMALEGFGYGGVIGPVGAAGVTSADNRVDCDYGPIDEWFVNGPGGLEQGFTILPSLQPGGSGSSLTVELALGGNLVATVNAAGDGLTLTRPDGSTALCYSGLVAYDATGRPLPASMEVLPGGSGQELLIHVYAAGAQGAITIDPYLQAAKLTASDGNSEKYFGCSVAVSGNTVVVGALFATSSGYVRPGAAYVFNKPGSGWSALTQTAKLTASDGTTNDCFGISIAVSGNTVVVGAYCYTVGENLGDGAAYVFVEPGAGWSDMTQTAKLIASDGASEDRFGGTVAVSGNTVVVGAGYATVGGNQCQGAAYVFVEPGSGWSDMSQTAKLTATDGGAYDKFGYSVAISGNTMVVGAHFATVGGNQYQGAAYVFVEPGSGWSDMTQTAKLTASDGAATYRFGSSVAISGDTVVIGAQYATVGSYQYQGAAYVFAKPGSNWSDMSQTAKLTATDGASSDYFGVSVSVSGNTVVVGAFYAAVGGNSQQGAAYVFVEPGSGWSDMSQTAKLTATDGGAYDEFGYSVAISGNTMVVGAVDATVGGNFDQGAAYVYTDTTIPAVTVTSPNGNETWEVGGSHTITWSVSGDPSQIASFLVSYSLDGGATYLSNVGTTTGASRSISWRPHPVVSPTAPLRIRVEALDASGTVLSQDASDGDFSLTSNYASGTRVVGYFPDYDYTLRNDIDLSKVTQINYFSVIANADGSLDSSNIHLSYLDTVVAAAHAKNDTVSITVGHQSFASIAQNQTALENFANKIVQFCSDHDLDGVDLDWEPTPTGSNITYYGKLIAEVYKQTSLHGLLLSAAVNPLNHEIPISAVPDLDWISVMDYDFNLSNHTTYADSVKAMDSWANYGVPKNKLLMGIPFYGRNGTTWASYSTILSDYHAANGAYPSDATNYANGFYYNGITTVKNKVDYVYGNGYGGIMIWELGQDDFGSHSLLATINSEAQRFLAAQIPGASLTALTGPQKGDIPINYTLIAPDSSPCGIQVQYSTNGGLAWASATTGTGTDGVSGLSSSPGGTQHTFVWKSAADLKKTVYSNVQVRITPSDGRGAGTAGISTFAVNYLDLTAQFGVTLKLPAGDTSGDGKLIIVPVLVKNLGNVALPVGQKINIEIDAFDGITTTPVKTLTGLSVSAWVPGASATFTASVTLPVGLAAGTYNLVAVVDSSNLVTESSETNNTVTSAGTTVVTRGYVDLTGLLGTTWTLPSAVVAGKSMTGTASVVVKNAGNVALPTGQNVNIVILAHDTTNGANPDITLATLSNQSVSLLAANGTKQFTATITRPAGMPADSYQILANITPVQALTEEHTDNNQASQTALGATKTITSTPPYVDLAGVFGTTWTLPTTIVHDKALLGYASVVVKNLGNVALPTGQNVTIVVIAHDTTNPGNPDITLVTLANQSVSLLAAGGTKQFNAYVNRPAGLPADHYQIEATITPVQALTESDLNDNTVLQTALGGTPGITVS